MDTTEATTTGEIGLKAAMEEAGIPLRAGCRCGRPMRQTHVAIDAPNDELLVRWRCTDRRCRKVREAAYDLTDLERRTGWERPWEEPEGELDITPYLEE